jgi:Sulfotransferase family/Domain of unknown function (DUF4214)
MRIYAADLVRAAYLGILKRECDPEGLATYSEIIRRTVDLAGPLKDLSYSEEHWEKTLDARGPVLVRALYQGLLGREPEPEELQEYAMKLAETHDLAPLLAEIARSDEHWEKTLGVRAPDLVRTLYQGLLGREPENEMLQEYVAQLSENHDLTPILTGIVRSDEHWKMTIDARAPELVRAMYLGLLGREPEPEALQDYTKKLAETHDLVPLLAEIAHSDEHWEKTLDVHAPDLVRAFYQGLLGRDADAKGLESYSKFFAKPNGLTDVLSKMIASQEFKDKHVTKLIRTKQKGNSDFAAHDLEEQKLVFLHLPKTGGTTLHDLLIQHFDDNVICPERFNGLRHYAAGELARYRYFSGHFDLPTVKLIPGQKRVITMLREPIARLISLYYFQRAHKADVIELNNLELARLANKYSMADFFRADEVRCHPAINNAMTRAFTQCLEGNRREAQTDLSIQYNEPPFAVALKELHALDAFGILERYDDSVALIFSSIGLPLPAKIEKKQVLDVIVEENLGLRKIDKEQVTDEIINFISDLVKVDVELYRQASEIFEQRFLAITGSVK